ncbi:DUF3783 domain-containing protein [Anaerovibrio sp.]|uniref:DUF3783 domain-containing protein n=1 Tax=Anaerovibrio sp. TaxID=1872532 RepID=UPI003F17A46E
MNTKSERVLLYQFTDEERREAVVALLQHMNIAVTVLPSDAWKEKIGFLLGSRGFAASRSEEGEFAFDHEVMIMQNIRNKRLDKLLAAWREAGLAPVLYKAVVTPFNTLWTLRRLCQTMEKEHGAVVGRTSDGVSGHEEQKALSEDIIDE